MYVTAIQPANAIAAWPDGNPPRSGVPRPVHAFVAMTISVTRASAASVIVTGAFRRRSMAFVAGSPRRREKTR